tara:strand:- start:767 stop:1135 length:369 start_codon:yes stop_codon:yes gene_type:complete
MDLSKHIKQLTEHLKQYVKLEVEHAKYEAIEEGSKIIGSLFTFVFLLVFGCISTSLIGIFAGLYLSKVFGSYLLGFGVTSLGYILLFIIMVIFRKHLLEKPFINTAVKHIFKHLREKEEHKE